MQGKIIFTPMKSLRLQSLVSVCSTALVLAISRVGCSPYKEAIC